MSLKKELDFYLRNQGDLAAKYSGKVLVIKDEKVIAVYDSEVEAYFETIKQYDPGTFIIQPCNLSEETYTYTFHSRVAIPA